MKLLFVLPISFCFLFVTKKQVSRTDKVIVELNNKRLRPPVFSYYLSDGSTTVYDISNDADVNHQILQKTSLLRRLTSTSFSWFRDLMFVINYLNRCAPSSCDTSINL